MFLQTSKDLEAGDHLAPTFNQHLPANGKVLLIEDVGKHPIKHNLFIRSVFSREFTQQSNISFQSHGVKLMQKHLLILASLYILMFH